MLALNLSGDFSVDASSYCRYKCTITPRLHVLYQIIHTVKKMNRQRNHVEFCVPLFRGNIESLPHHPFGKLYCIPSIPKSRVQFGFHLFLRIHYFQNYQRLRLRLVHYRAIWCIDYFLKGKLDS